MNSNPFIVYLSDFIYRAWAIKFDKFLILNVPKCCFRLLNFILKPTVSSFYPPKCQPKSHFKLHFREEITGLRSLIFLHYSWQRLDNVDYFLLEYCLFGTSYWFLTTFLIILSGPLRGLDDFLAVSWECLEHNGGRSLLGAEWSRIVKNINSWLFGTLFVQISECGSGASGRALQRIFILT